ncbi:MAG: sulfite exporter TauE/SafE family protein [Ignavibacteriae bacterium]|nr:sulfite exporter TauE/SafE family protein [Ignavibacteriota bacterium]
MTNEFMLLLFTAISVAFLHTLTGPDHYLPFIIISKARNWSLAKTSWFTILCGLGHVASSIILGFVGIAFGFALSKLEYFESVRGSLISWLFAAFGLVYLVWGIYRLLRNRQHSHTHFHRNGSKHLHEHNHLSEHLHVHDEKRTANITPWILFTIFVFGPCEPLIPIVMYPAAKHNYLELIIVTGVFSIVTIFTMLTVVIIASFGIKLLPTKTLEKYSHVIAGSTILLCGLGMVFLGL